MSWNMYVIQGMITVLQLIKIHGIIKELGVYRLKGIS